MEIKALKLKSYDKVYITLDLKQSWTLSDIQGQIDGALGYIAGNGLFIISEKTVGSVEYMDFYLELREQMFGAHGLNSPPNVYIEGISVTRTCLISITFYAIAAKNDTVKAAYLYDEAGAVIGARLITRLVTYLYLRNIRLTRLMGGNPDEFKVWTETNGYILKYGFAPEDIVRSCITITDVHRTRPIDETGFEGLSDYKVCNDIVCMRSNVARPNLNHNSQIHYKLTSSYGQLFEDEDCRELMIEGKSDVKRTESEDDAYRQIRSTLENVNLLLDQAGMSYGDILEATCFFKRKEHYFLYLKIVEEIGVEDFCSSYAIGDATREDLLFELHATAYKALKID